MKQSLRIVFYILICCLLGWLIGRGLAGISKDKKITNYLSLNKLDALLNLVSSKYVEDVDEQQIIEDLIPKALEQLDPHSVYIPVEEMEKSNEDIEGSFSGIGIQFNIREDTIRVVAVITGAPAEKAGIRAGDRIVEINDSSFVGPKINNDAVMKKLRGKKHTKVKVGVDRNNSPEILQYTLERNDIPINSVDAKYAIDGHIAYIKINNFSRTTYTECLSALNMLKKKEHCDRVILDLRGNPGGLMGAALAILNEFLPKKQLMLYVEGKAYPREESYSDGNGSFIDMPIIILTDEWSASASEIMAGAIQDNDRGYIVGRRTYGKGLVQQQIPFKDGSAVRLTVAHYYIPSGRNIQKPYQKGAFEDYEMDLVNRYMHGEFGSKDSIRVNDSLLFHTLGGRPVYGGGGIIPDYFVPIDTSSNSQWFNTIVNKMLVYNFAAAYADRHRDVLNSFQTAGQLRSHLERQGLYEEFVNYTLRNGVKKASKDMAVSKEAVKDQLYAYIARNTLGEDLFWELLQENDPTLQKAVGLIKDMSVRVQAGN